LTDPAAGAGSAATAGSGASIRAAGAAPATGSRPTRSRPLTFGCLALGGLLAVVASAQPWWRASGGGATVSFPGAEATGGLSRALAVVALAGTLLVLVLRARGRQVVAVLLALVGVGSTLVGALRLRPSGSTVRTRLREVTLADSYALTSTTWPWTYAGAGLVLLAGSVLLLVTAPHWPVRPDRFDRTAPGAGQLDSTDPATTWKALDAGIDPTADADEPGQHPDVHNAQPGDTMGEKNQSDR
jgi:uncharacterized membrane protein (TIGR02234 family)